MAFVILGRAAFVRIVNSGRIGAGGGPASGFAPGLRRACAGPAVSAWSDPAQKITLGDFGLLPGDE
jgi:hypothetical protein